MLFSFEEITLAVEGRAAAKAGSTGESVGALALCVARDGGGGHGGGEVSCGADVAASVAAGGDGEAAEAQDTETEQCGVVVGEGAPGRAKARVGE